LEVIMLKSALNGSTAVNGHMATVPPLGNGGRIPLIKGAGIRRRKLTAKQRAAKAAQQHLGELTVCPSQTQAAQDWDVNIPYVRAATRLTPVERQRMADGAPVEFPPVASVPAAPVASDFETARVVIKKFVGRFGLIGLLDISKGVHPAERPISEAELVALGSERLLAAAVAAEKRSAA
jgi:hypothetical protein